jgi:hypothetical protein
MSLPMGPRLHEECETKVPRGELTDASAEACQKAIQAAYIHVYGNAHLMDYERSVELESQLLNGEIAMKDFVKGIAKSEFYQRNFYTNCSPMRTIELDFKHLLGRVPYNQSEISELIAIQWLILLSIWKRLVSIRFHICVLGNHLLVLPRLRLIEQPPCRWVMPTRTKRLVLLVN